MQLFVLFSLLFPFFLLEENAALPSDNFLALRSFSERVSTCALDYVADKAFLTNEYETLKGNTYLSCLYYTILGNGNGEGFPYFIKAYGDERIVEPTYEPFYFDQELIATKMHIPSCNIWDSEKEMSVETTQGCKGRYDFAHYLLTGTVISDRCWFLGCENVPEGEKCSEDIRPSHYKPCLSLVPSYQKDFGVYDSNTPMTHPPYMYQRNLPLVYRNERYFEDVHRWRLYGEIPVKLSPDSEKIQTLKAIVNDGKEHLFDIVETVMLGGESYGDGVAFWKLLR